MTRQKLKLPIDVPMVLQLENLDGQPVQSQYSDGPEYRYDVKHRNEHCLIYLPAQGRDAIMRSRATVGDEIELLKQKRGNGYVYAANVLPDGTEPPPQSVVVRSNGKPPATKPQPAQEIPTSHPMEDLLVRCFVVAGRASWKAWEQLKAEGKQMDEPIWEDIRATGATLFIERNKRERS